VPVLFHTGGALGIHPSEFSPPGRYSNVSERMDPRTVSPCRDASTVCESQPAWLRFLGFDPPESPLPADTLLACRPLDPPLGLTLPGHAGKGLVGFSPEILSRASGRRVVPNDLAPQSINQPPLGTACRKHEAIGTRCNPLRVFAPVRYRAFERAGSRAMCSPHATSCISADRPAIFASPTFYRSCPAAPQALEHS